MKQEDGSLRHETELIVDKLNLLKLNLLTFLIWFNACHAEDGDRRPGIGHFLATSRDEMY